MTDDVRQEQGANAIAAAGGDQYSAAAEKTAISRRKMLIGATGAAAVLGAVGARALAGDALSSKPGSGPNLWEREYWTLEGAGAAEWRSRIGTIFTAEGDRGTKIDLKLAAVVPMLSGGDRPDDLARSSAFAALFDPTGGASLAGDKIYTVSTKQYGGMRIFMTRGANKRLEAVFN